MSKQFYTDLSYDVFFEKCCKERVYLAAVMLHPREHTGAAGWFSSSCDGDPLRSPQLRKQRLSAPLAPGGPLSGSFGQKQVSLNFSQRKTGVPGE